MVFGLLPSWFLWYQVGAVLFICVVVLAWVYWKKLRLIWKIRFYRKDESGGYTYVGQKEFNRKAKEVKFDGEPYQVRLGKVCERDSNKTILCVDKDSKDYLTFGENGVSDDGVVGYYIDKAAKAVVDAAMGLNPYVVIIIVCLACLAVAMFFVGNLLPPLFGGSGEVVGASVEVVSHVVG